MYEQDDTMFSEENDPVAARRERYRREDYSDAHYEPEEERTIPPRYYTPPERTVRESRGKRQSVPGRVFGLVVVILLAALIGGFCGSVMTSSRLESRIEALETGLSEYETGLREIGDSVMTAEKAVSTGVPSMTAAGMSPAAIYEQATGQVVGIRTEITMTNFLGMTSPAAVSASGFVISPDGYILTNYHVVDDAYTRGLDVEVITYDGTEYNAAIVGVEEANDIAVLKIEAEGLGAAQFGHSDAIRVGDTVYAVGNPLGELEFSMSTGHVSALDRVLNTQESDELKMFQIDAAVNEGNSGGPVYDADGKVIGIVTAKYSSSGVEGLGFAIPIDDAKAIADELITKGYVAGKAFMGISYDKYYDSRVSLYYGVCGAYVSGVNPDSAAEKAGIRTGDIITSVGEYTIREYGDLKSALRHFSAFETTDVTVFRSGAELKLSITFDEATPENS